MRKRLTIATLCLAAVIAGLFFLLRSHPMDANGPVSSGRLGNLHRTELAVPELEFRKHPPGGNDQSNERIPIEFNRAVLSDVLNELVKRARVTVTADLSDIDQERLVTAKFENATPLEALQTIAEEYGLELLETDAGWWLRPVSYVSHVIYQPTGLNEKRGQNLLNDLRKMLGPVNVPADGIAVTEFSSQPLLVATPPAPLSGTESVTMDEEGIHVKANNSVSK